MIYFYSSLESRCDFVLNYMSVRDSNREIHVQQCWAFPKPRSTGLLRRLKKEILMDLIVY
jgi:hypothetical protein